MFTTSENFRTHNRQYNFPFISRCVLRGYKIGNFVTFISNDFKVRLCVTAKRNFTPNDNYDSVIFPPAVKKTHFDETLFVNWKLIMIGLCLKSEIKRNIQFTTPTPMRHSARHCP